MPNIERLQNKIAETQAYLAQLKARQQRLEQATRAAELKRTRREETRRRMICGAALLQRARAGEFPYETLMAWVRSCDEIRPSDLALFDADPLCPTAVTQTEQVPSARCG